LAIGIKVLTKGIKYYPDVAEMYLVRGQIHLNIKQFQEALKDFEKYNSLSSN